MSATASIGSPARLPFDRYQRYAFAARVVEAARGGTRVLRLLEVGSDVHRDFERFVPGDDVVYLDVARPADLAVACGFVQGDGSASPFRCGAFDVAIALDVLEHVLPERRTAFLAETLRVASRGVVIGAPFQSAEVAAHEARLNDYFRDLHGQEFPWFAEHAVCGLPELDDTVAHVHALGWEAAVCGTANLVLWAKLMQAHFYVNSEPSLLELRGDIDELYNVELADGDRDPPVYRHFIVCAPDGAGLQRLAHALHPIGKLRGSDLLRLQEHLDRLYEVGERRRSSRVRVEREQERAERVREAALHAEALAALERRGAEQDAALAELGMQVREKDAALAELGRRVARLEAGLVPATRAAWRTLRSRSAGVLRRLGVAARLAGRPWRSRLHRMRLEPLHDLVVDGDGFRSLGDDPQFLLHSTQRRLPRSWVVITFVVEPRDQWLSPKLCVDAGRGFSEEQSFPLPIRAGRRVECMLRLPDRVRALRLDPPVAPGRFALRDLTIREIGLGQIATSLVPLVRAVPVRPRELVRRVGQALAIFRKGGASMLVQRLLARHHEASDYRDWVEAYDTLTDTDRMLIGRHIDSLTHRPLISVVMPTHNTPEAYLRRAIESVRRQLYPHWELCIADDASSEPHVRRILEEYQARDPRIRVTYRAQNGHISAASNSAITLATGEFVALLDHDDELAEHALYMVALELDAHPATEIMYSDEDKLTADGRRFDPYFKPDWNPDLFLAQNLVTHLCVCRRDRVRDVGGFAAGYEGAQDWDLVMRIAERVPAAQIRHIPHILYHWRAVPGSTALAIGEKSYASAAQRQTLCAHFARRGEAVEILPVAGLCWRIRYPLLDPAPLVTAIIPTRDRLALLRGCITSLRERTAYPRLELVVIDNQSTEPATLAYLAELAAEPDVTLLRYDAPFNYSAINNLGARHARGQVLALLNNDIEAISADWLEEMVSQACRPEIGAVGAMLYYPNDTIQHAGVILGLGTHGVAAHAYAYRTRGYGGQSGRALLSQTLSAVTAACLVVRREVFEEVNGFDEVLSTAYNDVDLCLRIRGRGYRNLWTPHAELYHHESASRGYEDTPGKRKRLQHEAEYMRRRWGMVLRNDPAYNPNLSLDGESFTLAFPSRAPKPWLGATESDLPARAPAGGRV